jgi:serine/threonine protein kinase/Flp pilus assembly protein TadD
VNLEQWRRVDQIFQSVLEHEPDQRSRFLDRSCSGDPSLREQVEKLLRAHEQAGGFLESDGASLTGNTLGSYQVQDLLGVGGMGKVYRAWDTKLKRNVALKFLPDALAQDADRISRFRREAEMLASLNHPNIAVIYDVQEFDSLHCLVLEFVDGETLAERISRKGPMPAAEAVAIALQVAGALQAAHQKGIIHRDIKAANIMQTEQQVTKVLDFGIARQLDTLNAGDINSLNALTATGIIVGTPQYMSPEVLQGTTADTRSDLWAFGVVLYQMLAGRLPFEAATVFGISSSILKDSPPPLPASVPPALRALVSRCLEKRPEQRYATASEIRTALEGLQSSVPASAVSRRKRLWVATGVVAASLLSGVGWWYFNRTPVQMLSTGGSPSPNQEANDLFELAATLARVQNAIPQAQATFDRALALDPNFSEARRFRALYRVIYILNGYGNDASELYRAEEELRQVAADAPELTSLPASWAAVYVTLGRKELVPLEKLDRSVAESSADQTPAIWRAILHLLVDENQEAKELFLRLLKRDPVRGPPRQLLGEVLRSEGDTEGAIRAEQRVMEQAPSNISAICVLSTVYLDQGNTAAARALLEEKKPLFSTNYLWKHSWALLLAVEGKRDEARQAMDEETLRFADVVFWATTPTADFYALLGENSKALDWLQKAVRNGDERINYFRRNPRLASIRNDPRFQSIINTVEARRAARRQ